MPRIPLSPFFYMRRPVALYKAGGRYNGAMVVPAMNRIHAPVAAFMALAVMAGFCLTAGPLRAAGFAAGKTGGGTVESFIPSPAEEPALLSKTEDPQFTPPWTEFQRIFKARGGASAFYRPAWGPGSNTVYTNLKNSILLKLRI